ncbi:hypothetical protein GRI39_13680 [Altererythrobacter indicus]|uniref:VanZ family protein n=1 Tax=Altericroceibacterium indicum TaxID=374177 RepID=A0A845ACF9_9SPHN|nr:hypothetical protein [Altericroceibacterium indicum]MXP27079.1 hypothetical protein [Altericroceibacterium indicum]
MHRSVFFRILLWGALLVTSFLALTPGPVGQAIESSHVRHAIAFVFLPWLTMVAYPHFKARWVFLLYVMFGGLIEIVQLVMQVGRHGQWSDWFYDIGVTLMAVLAGLIVRAFVKYPSETGQEN